MKNDIFLPSVAIRGERHRALVSFLKKSGVFLYFSLLGVLTLSGCGDDLAPVNAIVSGPEDDAATMPEGTGFVSYTDLTFKVSNSAGLPVSGVEIEFQANGTIGAVFITDVNRNPTGDVAFAQTTTDDRGLATVSVRLDLPSCGAAATEDRVISGGVSASVGVSSDTFTSSITLDCVTGSSTKGSS